jgi:DNA-binding IscR family transcriptional regulator
VKRCKAHLAMTKVRDAMSDILDMITIADLLLLGNAKKTKVGRRDAASVR